MTAVISNCVYPPRTDAHLHLFLLDPPYCQGLLFFLPDVHVWYYIFSIFSACRFTSQLCAPQVCEFPGAERRCRQRWDVSGAGEPGAEVPERGALRQRHQIRQVLRRIRESELSACCLGPPDESSGSDN